LIFTSCGILLPDILPECAFGSCSDFTVDVYGLSVKYFPRPVQLSAIDISVRAGLFFNDPKSLPIPNP